MHELTPTFISQKGYPTTHFDMDAVEAIGLVKIDILAQGGLAVMRDVKTMLAGQEHHSTSPSPRPSPPLFHDPQVWDMIASGGARAVHHIESPAMISLCRMTNVRDIDGLIAIVSVIRPGAANEQKKLQFTRRYQGLEPVAYPHPSLEPFLKSTFGLVVYEEHILQICAAFAGLPLGRADTLRRALVKQRHDVIDEIQSEFFAAARARGHDDAKIAEVWSLVRGFAGYAFCKAHSTAYGVEAYQSAWLKRYFPAEFMAAVLTHGKGFYHPLVYVLECHRLGIPLLNPWINAPGPEFKVEGRKPKAKIRVPATRVKGLTDRTQTRLLEERRRGAFESLRDFYRRVVPLPEEMEGLLRAGAFDGFGQTRTALFWEIQLLRRTFGPGHNPAQGWLFPPHSSVLPPNSDAAGGKREIRATSSGRDHPRPAAPCGQEHRSTPHPPPPPSPPSFGGEGRGEGDSAFVEPSRHQRLEWETDLLGFPVSGHPLELHDTVAWDTYCPVARLGEHVGRTVVTCGLVIEQRLHHQVTGEPMKFLTLADWTGMVETELFAPTYRSYGLATVRYPVLEITATVEPFENSRGFTLRVHRAGRPRTRPTTVRLDPPLAFD